jgi:chromosome segregation ATPase
MSTTRTIRRTVEHGLRQVSELTGGKGEALALMREQRDHEKQELIQLNDRFSSYLDRVKYLEQTNKQLQNTLDQLRSKWGLDSDRFKSQYEPQLNDLRKTIDLATVDKAKAEIRAKRADFDLIYYKKLSDDINQWTNQDKLKINSLQSTIEENQRELEHLQRLMADLMNDIDKYRNEMKHLYEEISRLLIELDQETMARIKIENEKQTLEEQIPFLSAIHEQEMNELRNLSSPNIGIDPTTFYKNELQRAIREIRNDFENLSRSQRSELEEYYKIKTDEIIQQAQKQKQQQNNQLINQENSNQIRISINETKKEMFDLQQDYNNYLQQMSQLESKLETLKRGLFFFFIFKFKVFYFRKWRYY